jgi:hypothetical protein
MYLVDISFNSLLTSLSDHQYKRGSKDLIQGSSLGKSHIAQVINALEKYRLNHAHSFPRDHETHISLRRDSRIRAFESASKHHEPKRVEKSQTVKAAGTSSGECLSLYSCLSLI